MEWSTYFGGSDLLVPRAPEQRGTGPLEPGNEGKKKEMKATVSCKIRKVQDPQINQVKLQTELETENGAVLSKGDGDGHNVTVTRLAPATCTLSHVERSPS